MTLSNKQKQTWLGLGGILAFIVSLFFILAVAAHASDYPPKGDRVNDQAGVLTTQERAALNTRLKAIEDERQGNPQFIILLPATLNGEDVRDYAGNVARAWGIGKKDVNNGILLVIAPKERKVDFEIGYGLEGTLPDTETSIIIDKMKPYLKKGQEKWADALNVAIWDVDSDLKAAETKAAAGPEKTNVLDYIFAIGLGLILVVGFILFILYRRRAKADLEEREHLAGYRKAMYTPSNTAYKDVSYATPRSSIGSHVAAAAAGYAVGSSSSSRKSSDDSDYSSGSSSSWGSGGSDSSSWSGSDSSSSSSDWSSGGGDFGGGGSSSDF